MTALKTGLTFFLIWVILGGSTAEAQDTKPLRGVALIIGQANYAHVTPLPNAAADARAIGKLMTDLGFETRLAPDRNAKSLKREIDRFIEDAEGADVALVYYAGHGIEAAGENWLVPVDADLSSLADARERLVPAAQLVDRLKQAAPVVIFLLDACRNSPFPADALLKPDAQSPAVPVVATGLMPSRGAAVIEDQPAPVIENVGTVMGFSAEPGHAALDGPKDGNSPYAQALLRHLSALGGADFGDVMTMITEEVYLATGTRQRPWVNASMRRLLYFGAAPQEGDKDEAAITGERRKLLLTIAALPAMGRRQVEGIAKSDQVPLDSLYGMLRSLGVETPKDPAELDTVLRAQAEKLKKILSENAALKSTDPEIIRLSGLADRALAQGALATAIAFREEAKARATSQSATLDQTEAALAARRVEIADVFSKSAETYWLAFNFKAAAADFEKAFAEVERWDEDDKWIYKVFQAEALRLDGLYKNDNASLRNAVSAFETAAQWINQKDDPETWAFSQRSLAFALLTAGEREADSTKLKRSVVVLKEVLKAQIQLGNKAEWIIAQYSLGQALRLIGEREAGTASLEESVAAFRAALGEIRRQDAPYYWADTARNLGVALWRLGERQADNANLIAASSAFSASLEELTRERAPLDWASTTTSLGIVLATLGTRESGTASLDKAVTTLRAALEEQTRARVPPVWAETHFQLGNVLLERARRTNNETDLRDAIATYIDAQAEITRERSPLVWATIENNLGFAYLRLGQNMHTKTDLEAARAATTSAWEVFKAAGNTAQSEHFATRLAEIDKALADLR